MTTYEIVGAHYRPPAKALISGLSSGTKLCIHAEPENQFDINAIQVFLKSENILINDIDNLNVELSTSGKNINDIQDQERWHLGYIRKELAKDLRESNKVEIDKEYEGEFVIDFRGKPMIEIDL